MIEATYSQAREQVTTLMDRAVVRRISVQRSPHPAHPMQHRHLNHQRLTLAAIDDLIARGRWDDWAALRQAVLADPYAQRHHFWLHYAQAHRTAA